MAVQALLIVGPAVTLVAAGRVDLSLDPVQGQEVAPVRQFPIRPVPQLDGRLQFGLSCMAVGAKGVGVTDPADLAVATGGKAVLFYEGRGVVEGGVRLQ